MRIVAVDPGKQHLGWAELEDGDLRCGRLSTRLEPPEAWLHLCDQVTDAVVLYPDIMVVEKMVAYPGAKRVADPNDLLPLAAVSGAVVQALDPDQVYWVTPADWKGQVPKNIHHQRLRKKMTAAQVAVVEDAVAGLRAQEALDVWDAVGLALWAREDA